MSSSYDTTALEGNLKRRYASELAAYKPPDVELQKAWKFVGDAGREGDNYNQMVVLTQSAGFTKAGSSTIATMYTLNNPIAAGSKNAQVQATETIGREWVPYGMIEKSRGNDEASYVDAWQYAVESLSRSSAKRQEYELLYGGPVNPVGQTIASMTTTVRNSAGIGLIGSPAVSATTHVLGTITLATWSPGLFGGLEGATLDVVDAAAATPTVLNTNGAATLTSINLQTRAIDITCAAGADATAIAAASAPVIYFRGYYGSESLGARSILSAADGATSSQSLFTIALKTFSYWDPVTFDCSAGPLTLQKLFSAVTIANARGLYGRVKALVPPSSWMDLQIDATAFRRFDGGYKQDEMRTGWDKLVYVSQAGELEVVPYLYMKCGDACILDNNENTWRRVGSTDITFDSPSGMPMILEVPDKAGRELRDFWAMGAFTPMPSRNVWLHNIVPNTTPS